MSLVVVDYRDRRRQLSKELDGGLLVLAGYDLMQQSADMSHPFRQEANFLYLTGITEPRWQMIYDGTRDKCWLVRPELSEVEVLFGGSTSDEAILEQSGADQLIERGEYDTVLRQCARQHASVYTLKPLREAVNFTLNPSRKRLTTRLERTFASVSDVARELADMRSIKRPEELTLIKRAVSITAGAFDSVRSKLPTYDYEYEIEAEFWLQFRRKNALHAYSPIIASGPNANILHYEQNNSRLKNNLVLMDCGASYDGYNADITRTINTSGVDRGDIHHASYEALIGAHQQIIRLIKPGLSFVEYQRGADVIMKQALRTIGLLDDPQDERAYRRYFPHAISHGIGIDVHESLGSSGYFKPGMVLTVEPGIYCAEKNYGMRVEDNILVTDTGRQNLSRRISTALQ